MSTATPSHADLYALACGWSNKMNGVFTLLQAVETILGSGIATAAALPVLRNAMEQIRDCDDEGELLNTLWRSIQQHSH
ncbi:hypothetical protein KP729_000163|uniref:hypothetical protein n=1 Tax=Delftia acidovorans TaxID=80866 RepID=UPI001C0CFC1A|nr:hypothetical protein [Delftia acidovorans]MCA1066829.1 hypothetical protein [Delftia acidovorans]